MLLQDCIKPEKATGLVAEGYGFFKERMTKVPNVVQMHSLSPGMLNHMVNFFKHYENCPNIDSITTAYIRLLISQKGDCHYCVKLNSTILMYIEDNEAGLQETLQDMSKLHLDEKRKALILFVVNMMYDEMPDRDKMNELKELGWTEKDIYEASMIGATQRGMIQMIKGFQVDIDY